METAPFDEKAFQNTMITSPEFELTAQVPHQVFKTPTFHELYRDVTMVRMWATKKDGMLKIKTSEYYYRHSW